MNPKVSIAIRFVHENLYRDIYVEEAARLVKLSRSRFSNIFKSEVGISFNKFLKRTRMEKACQLLETTFESIKTIAIEVGYHDPNYFEREFNKTFGCTPSQYRARYLDKG